MSEPNDVVALLQNYKPLAAPQQGLQRLLSQYKNLPQKGVSSTQALHDLSSVLLGNPFDSEIISYFSTVLVDVILDISSRQLSQVEFVQWCALAGVLAERMVHLRGLIEEVFPSEALNIGRFIEGLQDEGISVYLQALRKLLSAGCITDISVVDIATLLEFIVGHSDSSEASSTSSNTLYQAASLFFETVGGVSPLLQQEYLRGLLNAKDYAQALVSDSRDNSTGAGARLDEAEICNSTELENSILAPRNDARVFSTPAGQLSVLDVCGIKFPVPHQAAGRTPDGSASRSAELIYTENTLRNVRNIAAAVASEVPILLQGTAGSGKSFLIREFAALLGQKESLVELHLDDSTDSKSLIGNYTCSDVPGTFVWQPGLITQAVLNGHWLVIEDVDAAPAEIMAALVPLVERRRLYLPNRMEEVTAHPRFRIFGTRTITSSTSSLEIVPASDAGKSVCIAQPDAVTAGRAFLSSWHTLQLSPLASEEIKSIMTQAYPQLLSTVIDRLLSVYDCMSVGAMRSHAAKTSVPAALLSPSLALTIRSILKISRRIASRVHFNRESLYITEKQNEDMLMEVLDVVVAKCRPESSSASIASDAAARSMCEMIASAWGGVSGEDIYRLWNNSNPQLTSHSVEVGRRLVSVGRISITCSEPTESDTAVVVTDSGSAKPAAGKGKSKKVAEKNRQSGGVFAHASQTLRLLERVAGAVDVSEPILLVGETGCGKTTCVQQLAHIMGKKLIVLNISLSTDVNELLGGFRPVTMRQMFMPSYETFLELFQETFSNAQNTAYLLAVSQIFKKQNWKKLLQSFKKAATDATSKFEKLAPKENNVTLSKRWAEFMKLVSRYEVNLARIENGFAFAFVEGLLVDAMRKGHWILLDEINLASPETLQGLTGILDGLSLCLTERGDIEPVQRDPEFRIFAAMNPPTDVGKRELSPSLRSRFTEIYVDEMLQESDLHDVVMGYLGEVSGGNAERVSSDVVTIYLKCRELSETVLVDTAGVRPRYSLRSLTRALKSALSYLAIGIKPLNRALYESFLLTFATLLDEEGKKHLASFFQSSLNLKADKQLSQPPTRPGGRSSEAAEWVLVKPFWLRAGATDPVDWAAPSTRNTKSYMSGSATEESTVPALKQKRFVLTPSVEENIRCLSAAVAAGVAPVLLQGPTSVGKTSMIEYLAARTGHKCVRINNHEHTDVQEYIGGYITNDQGRLVFNDGLLVQALRCGHWIILDELNLAPSDVLEALNRLLDDNKELLIPETGELVHPSPGFALFATQNPPGIYGGRKPLSRAFRNRFIEIHIGDLPLKEIEDIVHQVCGIPKKFSSLEVAVMNELQLMRQQSNLFQGKHGALTTRDLIKWGNRKPDSVLAVAIFGYMLLAEKLRNQTEKNVIIETLQNVCKVKLDLSHLYKRKSDVSSLPPGAIPTCIDECARLFGDCLGELDGVRDKLSAGEIEVKGVTGVAPTVTVQRMWLLINQCVNHSEAVLLVGETGSGKTTVCQLLAAHRGQDAHIVNCHQSTETADIIGGLRPVRNRDAIFVKVCKLVCELYENVVKFRTENNTKAPAGAEMTHTTLIVAGMSEVVFGAEESSTIESALLQRFTEDTVKQSMAELKVCIDGIQSSRDISLTSAGEGSPLKRARVEEPAAEESYFSRFDICMNNITNSWKRYKALFEWQDGPLVLAMKRGDMFVLDEINLADDAVIERLNSVLESGREITLAEKGGENGTETEKIVAHPNFRFMGTMNPGGDFGKRELSPALRSRFTELWVPAVQDRNDLVMIVREMLAQNIPNRLVELLAVCIVDFADWIEATATEMHLNTVKFSVREIVAWVKFISFWTLKARSEAYSDTTVNDDEHVFVSYVHGAQVLVLDGLGIGSSAISRSAVLDLKNLATNRLVDSCPEYVRATIRKSLSIEVDQAIETAGDMDVVQSSTLPFIQPEVVDDKFVLGYFSIPCGNTAPDVSKEMRSSYVLSARSTVLNMHRVLRALQLPRPILLEGAPGVGKTSLISSLAKLSGHKLVRINLSEHSEISDLLGTDLPKVKKFSDIDAETGETANGGNDNAMSFAWCDGIFLSALKRGDWVLLDELNLAPQSVLEGLNACFDHRGEIFLPEIGLSFKCPPSFRVFCAQNPVMEGGGRKGLPQSFLSRFSRVFVDPMSSEDMQAIAMTSFADSYDSVQSPNVAFLRSKIPQMIQMITGIQKDLDPVNSEAVEFARMGNPWEFNLRDVIRWCEIFVALSQKDLVSEALAESAAIANSFDEKDFEYVLSRSAHLLFVSRMRTQADREHMAEIYYKSFLLRLSIDLSPEVFLLPPEGGNRGEYRINVGTAHCCIEQYPVHSTSNRPFKANGTTSIQFNRLFGEAALCFENIALCVNMKWPALLIGPPGAGKRRTIRYLAEITGNHLVEFSMTSSVDASDILGSFEQSNMERKLRRILRRLERVVLRVCSSVVREVALSQSQFKSSFSGTEQSVVISMVNSWRNISTLSREVFQHDLIRLDKGKELLQVIEHLISMLWESQELTMKHSVSELNPADAARKEVLGIREDLLLFVMDNNSVDSSSGFEWIDGILLEAMQLGQWLLFDNVNQCTPSVLDRLNSLLEPNGTILLTENGTGEVVKPHDNFRIFFVMDATNGGEISRAMRNRCVECYCPLSADIDLMLSDISSTSGSKSTDTQVLSSLVKSTPANDNDSTPSGSASPTSWIEGGQKKSVYRAYKKFYRILSVLQNCCSRVFSRADIYHMTAELMGPLINQRFAFERVREILHNASCDQPDADVSRRYDFPVSYLPWNNVFRTLPSIATAALQLIAVLDQCRSHTVPENGTEAIQIPLSIIYISDLTTPAMALATNFCARLSKENREIVKLLSSLSAPSKYTILAEPTYADDSMQYFCAVSFFIRVCSFILTTPTVDTVLEYISSGSFPYWHGSEFAREWVVAMIEYLRYSTNNENGVRGSYLSPASVSLRLPRNRIDDRNRVLFCLGCESNTTPGSGSVSSKRLLGSQSATESSASFALSLVDSFVVPRLRINFVESSQSSKLDTELMEQHSGKAGAIGLSLFLIGEAVDSGKLTSGDSKQIYLISSLYLVLKKCGGLIRSVWGLLCTEGINEDLLSRFVEACGVLTRRRDILSTIMLYHSCDLHNLKSSPIPLDKIVVAARWLKKSLAKTADFVDACDVVLGPQSTSTFKQAIVDLKIALSKFDRSIDMYWGYKNRLGLSARNGLLWKLGGHAAVPFLSAAWPTLVLLREIIGPVSAASLLKSFTDNENAGILVSVAENSALLSSRLMKRRLTFDTVRDWLGLYSTYYWSQTKELEEFGNMQRTTGHKNVDMHRLALQFSDLAESTWGNAERSPTDHELAEDHDPNVFTGHQFALIAQENEACGENFMTTIAEMHVFRCLHHVSNHLSLIILKNFARFDRKKPNSSEPRMSLRSAVESLKYLNRISSRTIEVAIRFTLFDPLHMRELQSLVWVLDSLVSDLERIKDFRKLSSKWAALENVARAYVVTLDTRIAAFFSRNVSNFMSSVDFSWMSPTLLTSLDLVPKTKKMQLDDSERESNAHIRNGSALLLRPMGLEAVLRMVDFRATATSSTSMKLVQEAAAYTKNSGHAGDVAIAEIPISTCADVRTKIQQLYRMYIHCQRREGMLSGCIDVDTINFERTLNIGKYFQLAMMTVDTVTCFMDIFDSKLLVRDLDALSDRIVNDSDGSVQKLLLNLSFVFGRILTTIMKLDILAEYESANVLWTASLKPLLRFLAGPFIDSVNDDIVETAESDVMSYFSSAVSPADIGEAWVHLGCLRAHFVLSDAPVDPATISTVKATMLSKASEEHVGLVHAAMWAQGLTGGVTVSKNTANIAEIVRNDNAKIDNLLRRSIQRRESQADEVESGSNCIQFSDVYDILKKGIDNLVSVEKLSLLLHKSKEFSEVVSKFNSILDVPRLSEKEKQSIKHAVAGLKTCNDEELNWQGSYVAFQGHVSNACSEYEDVTSVVLSAMENISFGLRLAVSWRGSRQVTSVAEVVVVNVADAAISSALQYPFSSAITVNSKSSNGLLVQLRTQFVQSLNLSLSSVDVLVSRTETLCGSRSKPVVTTALLLQLLSKIDYFVGSKLVDPSQVSRIFHSILKKLQYFYASSEQERIKRQAEKDSMFKNRVKENTFISDDAEEETRDLRLNFPDHLAEFQSIVKSDVANEDIDGAGVADDESVEGAVEGVTEVADDCTSAFDFTTMSTDISSYHARMIFLHEQFDLATRGRCWSTANVHHRGINRVDSLGANSTVELMQSCIQRTLVVTKTLHGAIDHLVNPRLDLDLSGISLLVMSNAADHCQISVKSQAVGTHTSFVEKMDRDLCFLLFQDAKSYKSPSSFHVDPCKEEILHAAGPLNRLLKKASALLVEYPGNEILLQLCKLTARISQFHISTPLGKMLASIELLYREAHHWESYAAKHVSIIEEINGLGSLIARWREKELQSWEDLLRCKEQDYAVKAIQYWFTLSAVFDSVFALANVDDNQGREEESGVASLCISDAVELTAYSFSSWQSLSACSPAWLLDSISDNRKAAALAAESTGGREVKPADVSPQQKLFESLDGFLKGATVGEFPTRLHLVRLFALNLQQIYMRTKTNNATLLSSVNLAMNMWKFYDQFLSAVRGFQDILKSPIQKRIKDEIKISKWDQLSSYGLMEHSEKIHRKLNKIIREYQIDVLDYPVTSLLRKEAVGELAGENGDALQSGSLKKMPALRVIFPFISKSEPACLVIPKSESEDVSPNSVEADGEVPPEIAPKAQRRKKRKPTKFKADAVVIKNTSSALEGIDFGHCDETVFKQLSLLKQTDGFNGASVDSKLASVLLRYPRVSKVNSLLPKVHKSLKSLLLVNQEDIFDSQRELDTTFGRRYLKKCRFGYLSHELAEDMCSDIFGYMSGLQGEDVSRNQKQRALRDLLDALKERVGASQFHIDVPLEFKEAAEMLTAPVPLSTEISSDIFWDFSCPRDCLEKAETYFVKNVSEINELRTQAACEFSPDLSGRDVHAMTGYAENMLMRCFSIRGSTTALLSDIQVVTKESNALLETVRAVQDYRSEYMRIAKCDGDVLNSSTDASLITYALTFKRTVEEAWKYRKVAGSVLINSLSELEKLSGPALAALQQSDNVGSNADITSVFEDSHISRDVVGRVINDVSSLLSELHSAIYPKVDNIDYQAAPLLHATDVFGYEPSDGTSQEGGGACGVAQVKAALIDSESVITNCERRFANSRDVLCSILPPEVVEPIIAQFRAFVSTIRDQHEAFDALHSKTVDVLECSEGSTSRLDHGDTKVKDEYTERVVKIVQSSIDECLLSVQRLQFLSLSETSADEKKKSIKSFFGDRVINIPTFDEEDEFDVISCFELNSVGASALQLNKLAEMMRSLSTVFHSELHEFDFSIDMVNLFQSAALMVSSITLSSRILLEDMIRSYKSFSKMTYVCIRIFRNLIAKGFCTSSADTNMEDGEGSGEGTMTFEDDVDGTGMGEGDGKKDVSDEIENEEQLLGLKDDKPNEQNDSSEKKELDEKDKDTGVEMNQDFDGELYDIPEDENEEKQDDEEEDEEEDLDREMDHGGEFSYDNVVDEQQWGSDDDEDDDNHGNKEDNKEMFEEGNAMDSEALEGEMRTNDQDEAENKPGQDDKPEKNEDKGGDDQNDDEDMNGKVNDEDEADTMEKPMGVDVRKADEAKEDEQPTDEDGDDNADPADADMQDQTTGAFDDDQKDTLGGPQGDMQDDVAGGDDEDMDVENMSISNDSDNDDNESVKSESPDDVERNEPDGPDADAPAVQDGGEQDQELDLNEGDRKQKKKKSASSAAFGVQAQDGADAMQKDDSGGDGNAEKNDQQVAAGQASGQGSSTSGQNDPGMEDGAEKDPADVLDSAEPPDNSNESGGGGDNDTSGASNADAMSSGDGPPNNRHREPPNPFRKKGDLDKAWHERLNMKKQKQDGAGMDKTSNKETGASGPSSGVFEYEMNDGEDMELDDPTSGEQVLAETVEGDAMKLQNPAGGDEGEEVNVNEQEGGEEGNGEDGFNTKGVDNVGNTSDQANSKRERETDDNTVGASGEHTGDGNDDADDEPERKRKKADHSSDNSEDEAAEPVDEKKYNGEFDDESAMDDIKDLNQFPDDEKSVGSAAEPDVLDFGGKILSGASLTGSAKRDDAADDMNCEDDLEQTGMVEFKETTVVPTSSSAAIWAHHKSIGDEASMNLCEQLRLVLEPNLAARLKGDYRTGKRINMRRVISYVASGFRRDKIWLRRTKLAKRDYQVMLMIDDSCSMGAAGPLAMTSLAIISSALSRLEVGDLAVCSFSDHVNMLHPFGSPFTDDSGAGVANSLKFNASQTLLAGALDSVIPVFDAARHGQMSNATGSGVVVQLCFLISDARLDTDNRERLNNVVRRMAEKHILVVLIILDQNEDSKDSIFNTKSIEFTDEGIVTRSYLDNFPFPFYVAIQKLSALPNVLADSLKQWFEYVQYSLDSNNN